MILKIGGIQQLEKKIKILINYQYIVYIFITYQGDDDLSGAINIKLGKNKKIEHIGIIVELVGHVGIIKNYKRFLLINLNLVIL